MLVHVGSKNPAKVGAVRELVNDYPLFAGADVSGIDVPSGVSEQSRSLPETIDGAMNRARAAFSQGCAYNIGLESGLMQVPHTKTGWMDMCVCAIFDGKAFHLGISSAFEYPKKIIICALDDGIDLSEAAKKVGFTDCPKIGEAEGLIGILTNGRVDRKEYTKQALIAALIHLEHPHLY